MADTTKNIWNDSDGEDSRPGGRLRKVLVFILILAVVLGVVLVAAWRDGTGFDALRRYFSYGGEQSMEETGFTYDASGSNRFAALGDGLVVLSETALEVQNGAGETVWSTQVKMREPALTVGGGRAVAYDIGGTELHLLDETGELMALTADEEEPLISATLNSQGMLTVTAEKRNYKGCVSVYSRELDHIFDFKSSPRFVLDGYMMEDGDHLAAVTLGQENSVFVSNVVLYDLSSAGTGAAAGSSGGVAVEPAADYSVSDGLVMGIGELDGKLVTVADTRLTLAEVSGQVTAEYVYADEYLREFDIAGGECAVLLLNRYQAGSVGRLVTVGPDGMERASLDIQDEVLDISAAGRYLAVLYADQLVIYNLDLQVYAQLQGTGAAREVLMREDGSALLAASESARLFLP